VLRANCVTPNRDKFLLQPMWVTGARISDVLTFTDNSIDFTKKTIRFCVQKKKDKHSPDGKFWLEISFDMETSTELMAYT
jgi:integrase